MFIFNNKKFKNWIKKKGLLDVNSDFLKERGYILDSNVKDEMFDNSFKYNYDFKRSKSLFIPITKDNILLKTKNVNKFIEKVELKKNLDVYNVLVLEKMLIGLNKKKGKNNYNSLLKLLFNKLNNFESKYNKNSDFFKLKKNRLLWNNKIILFFWLYLIKNLIGFKKMEKLYEFYYKQYKVKKKYKKYNNIKVSGVNKRRVLNKFKIDFKNSNKELLDLVKKMELINFYGREKNKRTEFETNEELPVFFLESNIYLLFRFIDYYIKMNDIIQEIEYFFQQSCYGYEIKKYEMHGMIKKPFFFSLYNLSWEELDNDKVDGVFTIYQQSFFDKKYIIFVWVRVYDNFSF